jgi:hypothetical protein
LCSDPGDPWFETLSVNLVTDIMKINWEFLKLIHDVD